MEIEVLSPIEVEADIKKYTLVGDDIFMKRYDINNIPQWYKDLIDTVIASSTTIGNINDLMAYLNSLPEGYNFAISSIRNNDILQDSTLESLKTSDAEKTAAIATLNLTKITATDATAISNTTVAAYFNNGSAGAWFDSRITAYASAIAANATSMTTLAASLAGQTAIIESLDYVSIDLNGYSLGASKLGVAPDGSIVGWQFADGTGVQSTFKIMADKFTISDGTTAIAPFTVENGEVNINGRLNINKLQSSMYIGEYTTAPTSPIMIGTTSYTIKVGDTYKNTGDNIIYVYTMVTGSNPVTYTWLAQKGADGASIDIVFIRSASAPSTPVASPSTPTGWYTDVASVPASADKLWSSTGQKVGGVTNFTWGTPIPVEGSFVREVTVYYKGASAASLPASATLNATTNALSTLGSWTLEIPTLTTGDITNFIWATTTVFAGTPINTAIASSGWSAAVKVMSNGTAGTSGTSTYTATVYLQQVAVPIAPSGGSYNFSTSALTPPTGWVVVQPATTTTPTYATEYTFTTITPATPVTAGTWGTVRIDAVKGADGTSGTSVNMVEVYSTSSSTPTSGAYDFATNTISSLTAGWSMTQPAATTTPTYMSRRRFSVVAPATSATDGTWSTPVVVSQNGSAGTRGSKKLVVDIQNSGFTNTTMLDSTTSTTKNRYSTSTTWTTSTVTLATLVTNYLTAAGLGSPVIGDEFYFILYSNDTTVVKSVSAVYTNTSTWSWNTVLQVNGDAVIAGTLYADAIVTNSLTVTNDAFPVNNHAIFLYQTHNNHTYLDNNYFPSLVFDYTLPTPSNVVAGSVCVATISMVQTNNSTGTNYGSIFTPGIWFGATYNPPVTNIPYIKTHFGNTDYSGGMTIFFQSIGTVGPNSSVQFRLYAHTPIGYLQLGLQDIEMSATIYNKVAY